MRFAVSGSHGTGKSTLIAAFLARCPAYRHEPEAFETLGDDIDFTPADGPTPEGLQALLEYTLTAVTSHRPGEHVVFERSPVDYLAYAAVTRSSWRADGEADFVGEFVPRVRASLRHLDLIALLPVSGKGPDARPVEDRRFRKRVDEALRRALVDDAYDLFGDPGASRVVELSPVPERQLAELVRLAGT